jgi:cytochrome c553
VRFYMGYGSRLLKHLAQRVSVRGILALALVKLLLALSPAALAAGVETDISLLIAAKCSGCHGSDGVAKAESWPNLACQKRGYLYSRLLHLKSSKDHHIDKSVTELGMAQIAQIAEYYSSLPCPRPH